MNRPHDDLELLRRLRQLPREREPSRDLWRGIESRLSTPVSSRPRKAPRWRRAGLAMAASLLLAMALVALLRTPPHAPVQRADAAGDDARSELVRRQAEAIAIEYRLAIELFASAPMPPSLEPAADELDASAASLHLALREQPDAAYLLERLRHTYDQRLKLARRAALG